MKNMKIREKLIVSFMIVAALAVTVGGVGILGMREMRNSGTIIHENIIEPMPNLSRTIKTLLVARIYVREMVMASMTGDFAEVENAFATILDLVVELDKYMDAYRASIKGSDMLQNFDKARGIYENSLVPVILAVHSASQRADIPTILYKMDFCRKYSDIILGIFDQSFDALESYAQTTSERSGVLAQTLFVAIIAALAVALVATLLLAFYISSMISRPIRDTVDMLKEISEGEGDLTHSIKVQSKDEIGDLAKYFNETINKIKALVVNIRREASAVSAIGADLSSNMGEAADSVNEITASVKSIKSRILSQSSSVSQTHSTMEQVVVHINQLNEHVESQSTHIAQASSAIEEMVANTRSVTETLVKNTANVRGLKEASEVGRAGLREVAADIKEIARESEGLLEINSVMKNIASRTNLLSMNAAIEAAHAGVAGRGFAVVADEIRKLAENSGEQSKTVGAVLKKIKESIDQITASTENVLDKFELIDSSVNVVAEQEENMRNAMEEQGTGSRQILEGVGKINEMTWHVKSDSQEMLKGVKEVIRESETLEKATQMISSGINDMDFRTEQINAAVSHVNGLSAKNRENSAILHNEVSRFKVD